MKFLSIIVLLLATPFITTAQFSSAQRQMNATNQMNRQQNQMFMQMQQQQRLLINNRNGTETIESKLAKENKKIAKLQEKSQLQGANLAIQNQELADLKNNGKNLSEKTHKKMVNNAEKKIEKSQDQLNKINSNIDSRNLKVATYTEQVEELKLEKEELEKKQEAEKKLKRTKKIRR